MGERNVDSVLSREAIVAVLAVLAGASGCVAERADRSAATVEGAWQVDPTPVVVLGDVDGPPEYLFDVIRSVHLVSDDRFVVGQWGGYLLRVYDLAGNHLRTIGRRGEGPGEWGHLSGTWLSEPDTVHALDQRLRRTTSFLLDGTLLGTRSWIQEGWVGDFAGAFGDGGIVLARTQGPLTGYMQPAPGRRNADLWVSRVTYEYFGADGQPLGRTVEETGDWWYLPATAGPPSAIPQVPGGIRVGIHPFSPRRHMFIHGDTMFSADGLRPEVTLRASSGEAVRSISLPHTTVSFAEAMSDLRRTLVERGTEEDLARFEAVPALDSIPRIAAILMDDQGLIWAKKYHPAQDAWWRSLQPRPLFRESHGGEWWVIDREGKVLSTVTVPDGVILMAVRGSLMAGITVDELGVERVVIYRILGRS